MTWQTFVSLCIGALVETNTPAVRTSGPACRARIPNLARDAPGGLAALGAKMMPPAVMA